VYVLIVYFQSSAVGCPILHPATYVDAHTFHIILLQVFGIYAQSIGVQVEDENSRKQWTEDMDIDEPTAPTEFRERVVTQDKDVVSLVLGGGDRSYVLTNKGVAAMENTPWGLNDLNMSLSNLSIDSEAELTPDVSSRRGRRSSFGTASTQSITPPSKAMLMNRERQINLLTPDSGSILNADLETGQIVNEYRIPKTGSAQKTIFDITPESKSAQLEPGSTFLSLAPDSINRWDTRTRNGIVEEFNSPGELSFVAGRDYKKNPKFTCMASSGDGYRAVGSNDGQIRLYNHKTEQIAKTVIPSLGAPITDIDVTYDGRWVIATTASFIIVLKTFYKDGAKELCGFTSRMGTKAPAPRLLRLTPEDVVLTKGAPLKKAKFTWVTESGHQERYIAASCGNYMFRWNFRQIKRADQSTITNGLTTISQYKRLDEPGTVQDFGYMHENYNVGSPFVCATQHSIFNIQEEGSESEN